MNAGSQNKIFVSLSRQKWPLPVQQVLDGLGLNECNFRNFHQKENIENGQARQFCPSNYVFCNQV